MAESRSDDELHAELQRLASDSRAADEAGARARARVLRQLGEEEATFAGVALDLAERVAGVTLRGASGRTYRGRVVAVGRDFLVVREGEAAPAFVTFAGCRLLRPAPATGSRGAPVGGSRRPPVDASFGAVLAGIAPERPRVHVPGEGGQALAGELRAVGADVVVLRLDDGGLAYLPLASVQEIVVHDLL